MNRFKTKKKAKDDAPSRPSQDSESFSFRFRKGKKTPEEEKPEIDLATALPSSDDFRTSLLMSGLSARFSMLREQDDPNTKIGKASDDSVLFPKRQSRLADLGSFNGLSDIAEVESIKAPFARMDSYFSDADSINGSIMTRAKPTEGNVLFGGRQKIYKIPAGSASNRAVDGGMSGRAVYDDDVALSAFQKWRREEREQKLTEGEGENGFGRPSVDEVEARPESPFSNGYNRKRETSSTTSSIPSMARNSTAATSVTSQQPASSVKDWPVNSPIPPTTNSTPTLERAFTRTRRLYETGLNNDLQEQQTSALSRIDTLTRRRDLGARTPDLSQNSPSPTAVAFADRFGDRRILAKASAPNLRSSSPASRSSAGTPDLGGRVPSIGEAKPSYVGTPPLSPPISEAEELSALPIQPNDRGKATALGVFAKPAQPYDESRFAERQLQLQQGRDTPTQRTRAESGASFNGRSRSSSSAHRQPYESKTETFRAQPTLQEEVGGLTFFNDDADVDESPVIPSQPTLASLPPRQQRPADSEHPALRGSNKPTLSTAASMASFEPSSAVETGDLQPKASPPDSPTLGPAVVASAGLSGMVRQHLRADSGASSIYGGGVPATSGFESRFPTDSQLQSHQSSTWETRDANDDRESSEYRAGSPFESRDYAHAGSQIDHLVAANRQESKESDEFASQLADGARRIRERLTTYVESDASPDSLPPTVESRESPSAPHPARTPLNMMRTKSSRSSLADRGRDTAAQQKAMKMLGISDSGPSVLQRKASFENPALLHSASGKEEIRAQIVANTSEDDTTHPPEEQHAGIRAFRQARREMQRLKELDIQQRRHPTEPQSPVRELNAAGMSPMQDDDPRQHSQGRDQKPPPVAYRPRAPSQDSHPDKSRSGSQEPSQRDRDRSGSNSSGERSQTRAQSRPPMRPRNESSPGERALGPGGNNGLMARSAGLPGTNIRRSPIMPPQGYPARTNQSNFGANENLHVQHPRGYDSGQPSPVSPMASPFFSSAPTTPGALSLSQRPPLTPSPQVNSDGSEVPGLNEAMKRQVRKRDISEPTFVMSTSRVPTMELPPEAAGNRSRSNSRSRSNNKGEPYNAPPLPPINPRRRQDGSKTRTVFGNMVGRNSDTSDSPNASSPNLALSRSGTMPAGTEESRGAHPLNNEEYRPERRPLRRMPDDAQPVGPMMRIPSHNLPTYGPPASRVVVTQNNNSRSMGLPGGMI